MPAPQYDQKTDTLYRPATKADVTSLVELAIKGLEKDPYPGLVIDRHKVYEMAKYVTSERRHYCWVAERKGKVVAAITALIEPMMFHHKKQATVIQFWTDQPGCGLVLIRMFLKWARARVAIRSIMFTVEAGADPRIGRLMTRLGLSVQAPIYAETR